MFPFFIFRLLLRCNLQCFPVLEHVFKDSYKWYLGTSFPSTGLTQRRIRLLWSGKYHLWQGRSLSSPQGALRQCVVRPRYASVEHYIRCCQGQPSGQGRGRQTRYCYHFVISGFANMTIMSHLLIELFGHICCVFLIAFLFPPTDLLSFVF